MVDVMVEEEKTAMSFDNVKVEVGAPVAVVTIDRPKVLNALNDATIAELSQAFDALAKNDEVRAIILTGGGDKAFVAGADIGELARCDVQGGIAKSKRGMDLLFKMENLPKPIIGAINGFALGGGCEIAMACDFRIASDNAQMGQPEVTLGIIPGYGGTQRLPRLVGAGMAKKLLYTGDRVKADEALRIGLVDEVVPAAELMDHCREMAERISKRGPLAIATVKKAVNFGLNVDLPSGCEYEVTHFGAVCASEDQKEGCNAFLEKRKPNFTGR
jgi:enoyl-CoA hydratase